jgi:shikimate dehydrogenase
MIKRTIPTLCGSIAGNPNPLGAEMHNAAYAALKLPYTWVAFGIDNPEAALAAARALNFRGLGVGVPYKQAVMPYLDAIDPVAKEIGAVNVIVNEAGVLTGFNVDWIGAVRALQEATSIAGSRSILVGAGGAAKAIAYRLSKSGGKVTIYNRSPDKAQAIADHFGIEYGGTLDSLKCATDYDILINATSVGLYNEAECPIDPGIIASGKIVFEVVHTPLRTALVRHAQERGALVVPGHRMLLHLSGHIFELFTQTNAPLSVMEQALMKRIGSL